MNKLSFNAVDVMLVDSDLNFRQSMAASFVGKGFKIIRQGNKLNAIHGNMKIAMPDLLIGDCDLPDGDFCALVLHLRHYGANPFLPIIAMLQNPTEALVGKAINSGADFLLTKPVSPSLLFERIEALIKARKPFVVTSDYIGPTRRPPDRDEDGGIPLMDVPNSLRAKATGGKENISQQAIDAMIAEINLQKLERHADNIGYLVDLIVPVLNKGVADMNTAAHLNKLLFVAEDTARRQTGTVYAHVGDLCQSLITVTRSLIAAGADARPKDLGLLKHLAQAIQASFDATQETADAARKISATVNRNQALK